MRGQIIAHLPEDLAAIYDATVIRRGEIARQRLALGAEPLEPTALRAEAEDLDAALGTLRDPEATPAELAWVRSWATRPAHAATAAAPAAVREVPDLHSNAIERLGLTEADLDHLGLDGSGRVADNERAASALAALHAVQAAPFGWLGLDSAAAQLGVGNAARTECRAEAAAVRSNPEATPSELAWAENWPEERPAPELEAAI